MSVVTCRGLICRLGEQVVLDGVDLDLHEGESLALLGSSGSGKSTLLRIIAGLELPERGEVLINGKPATRNCQLLIPPHRRQVAMLFQDLALWPNLTVLGNTLLGLEGLRLPRPAARTRAEEAMNMCGIAELAQRLPGTLSGGQQQRVALARALSTQPSLLMLDEPFSGLDPLTKHQIVHEIVQLKKTHGIALILVTHDPLETRVLCNALAVLQDGQLVDRVPLQELGLNTHSDLARAFAAQYKTFST